MITQGAPFVVSQSTIDEAREIAEREHEKSRKAEPIDSEKLGKFICAQYGFDPDLVLEARIDMVPGELAKVIITMILTHDVLASLGAEAAD